MNKNYPTSTQQEDYDARFAEPPDYSKEEAYQEGFIEVRTEAHKEAILSSPKELAMVMCVADEDKLAALAREIISLLAAVTTYEHLQGAERIKKTALKLITQVAEEAAKIDWSNKI